jgi:ubiquitin C-terminal hydrolase
MESIIDCAKFKNNEGYCCYRNSIIAILQSLPIFSEFVTDKEEFIKFYEECKLKEIDINKTVTYQIFKLFNLSLDNPNANLNPRSFSDVMIQKNPMWGEFAQQDSSEYFLSVLDKLKEERGKPYRFVGGKKLSVDNKYSPIKNFSKLCYFQKHEEYCGEKYKFLTNMYSPYTQMFNFMIKNTMVCPKCHFSNSIFESSSMLKLSLPDNNKEEKLEKLIDTYLEEEVIDSNNMVKCNSCLIKTRAKVTNSFCNLPKILVIHLKRFNMNNFGFFGRKKSNRIIYPLKLDLSKYVDDDKEYQYQLVSVNVHLGSSMNQGHYISIVKLSTDNGWYVFNDNNNVKPVTDINNIINNNASMLFYIRKN